MSSRNPALAAIQAAKREAEAAQRSSLDSTGSGSLRRGSQEVGSPQFSSMKSMGHGALATAKSMAARGSTTMTRNSVDAGAPSPLGNVQDKNVFGAEDGNHEKGWWAHTDAGTMNAEDSEQKKAVGATQSLVVDTAVAPTKKLDFSAMFANRTEEPAPLQVAMSSSPPAVAPIMSLTTAEVTSPSSAAPAGAGGVTSPASSSAPKVDLNAGPFKDEDGKAWWSKMDAGDLNKVEEHVKQQKGAFTPQFIGSSLVQKLDYSKQQEEA